MQSHSEFVCDSCRYLGKVAWTEELTDAVSNIFPGGLTQWKSLQPSLHAIKHPRLQCTLADSTTVLTATLSHFWISLSQLLTRLVGQQIMTRLATGSPPSSSWPDVSSVHIRVMLCRVLPSPISSARIAPATLAICCTLAVLNRQYTID